MICKPCGFCERLGDAVLLAFGKLLLGFAAVLHKYQDWRKQ